MNGKTSVQCTCFFEEKKAANYTYSAMAVCVDVRVALQLLDADLGNGTVGRTVTMTLLTSGLGKYEAMLPSYGTSPVGGGTDL